MPRESAWAGKLEAVFSAAGSAGSPGRRRIGPMIGQTQRTPPWLRERGAKPIDRVDGSDTQARADGAGVKESSIQEVE